MFLFAFFWKAVVVGAAVVPLVTVSKKNVTLPFLLDATIDELVEGLKCGSFSSVDLVEVSNATNS
jgi:amidase